MQKNLRSLNLEDVDHLKLTKKTLKLCRELQPSNINTDFKSMQVKVIMILSILFNWKYVGKLVCVQKIIHAFHEVRKYTKDYKYILKLTVKS